MRLTRTQFNKDGIFGRLYNEHGVPIAYTLEHAYQQPNGLWLPKLYEGQFVCVIGTHKLHNGVPFETFEITGVKGHDNILLHAGNFDNDSEGCVLLGQAIVKQADGSRMITNSKHTFGEFMVSLSGVKEFLLKVTNEVPHVAV